MNQTLTAALLLLLLTATWMVSANHTGDSAQDAIKADRCYAQLQSHLLAAGDPNQADQQEWHLRAADAYRQLLAMDAAC